MNTPVRTVAILGGGAAGWLTAGVLAARHPGRDRPGVRVVLVESPQIPIIGVGEGTWPSIRDTLRRIGISETDFLRECDASFKQGSRFQRWRADDERDAYYHPFSLPHGYGEIDPVDDWLGAEAGAAFADTVCPQSALCDAGRAPKQPTTPEYAAVANYAYHLDAGRFAALLERHCTLRLGVQHVRDQVAEVEADATDGIAALRTATGVRIEADLFVDCSGHAARLIGGQLGVPLTSVSRILFNDTALAMPVPYGVPDAPIPSCTISTAVEAGWIWDIGLRSRRGTGIVYSSSHLSDERAEALLRAYNARIDPAGAATTPRKLTFKSGYRETPWRANCVAIGLAAGFVEPLEASAIAMVEFQAAMLADQLPPSRAMMPLAARRFNDAFAYRWHRVVDFLKLHYVLSARHDSDYWRDHRRPESRSERLAELLDWWRDHPPSRFDFVRIEEIFPAASWQYVLYGMGFRPAAPTSAAAAAEAAMRRRRVAEAAAQMTRLLPDNRALLEHLQTQRLPS